MYSLRVWHLHAQSGPSIVSLDKCLVHDAHVLKDHIEDICYYLDNYTTIGPSDQDSNLQNFSTF